MTERKKQLGNNIRELIIAKYNMNKPQSVIAEELGLNKNTVTSVVNVYKKEGRIQAKSKRVQRIKKIDQSICDFIHECINEDCSKTLQALKLKIQFYI